MTETTSTTMSSLKRSSEALRCTSTTVNSGYEDSPFKSLSSSYNPLYSAKCFDHEQSLAYMMSSRRSGIQTLHKKFTEDLEKRRCVSFAVTEDRPVDDEPPTKRRRFQRRNSKTAAMLLSSMASIVASDFADLDEECNTKHEKTTDDAWDGGLEIAEELVRQLKLRRQSLNDSVV